MSEWRKITLEEVVASANTGLDAIQRAPICEEETGIKCLRIQDISQSKPFVRWGNARVKEKDFLKAQLLPNDLIMARTCSPGIVYLVRQKLDAVFNNGLARIRPDTDQTNSIFLYYLFKSPDFIGHIYGISGGTSVQLNIKLGDLLSYQLRLPLLVEQQAIASVLSSLDDKIDLLHRQNKTLEAMAETLFRQWFVEEASEDWEEKTIADCHPFIQYGFTQSANEEEVGPKFLRITDIRGGCIAWSTVPHCVATASEVEKYRLESGDIVVARTGASTGENLYLHKPADAVFASYLVRFQFASKSFARYVAMHMRSADYFEYIDGILSGSAQPNANAQQLASFEIKVPPDSLLELFLRQVINFDERRRFNEQQVRTLENLRDTLLPKLMSGEVRVDYE